MTPKVFTSPHAYFSSEREEIWKSRYLEQFKKLIIPTSTRWGRLICTWHEKKSDGTILTHYYAACIDTKYWGLYLDCRPRKIFAKCFVQLLLRPLHLLVKTIYHLSMISIACEISNAHTGYQTALESLKNSIKNLLDIFRTPIYSLVLMVASVAVLTLGMFSFETLYSGRQLIGKIEQIANWGEINSVFSLAPCFQPFPLSILDNNHEKFKKNSAYLSSDPLAVQLSDFARRAICKRRRQWDLFACEKLNPQKPYTSPILLSTSPSDKILSI